METKLVAFGEVLEDQLVDEKGKLLHLVGGAPLNFIAMARKLYGNCHVLTCLGTDEESERALRMIRREKVGESMIRIDPMTVLAHTEVHVDRETGERTFLFHKERASFLSICPDDVKKADFPEGTALYLGTVSLLKPNVIEAAMKAVRLASFVLFDPNRRPTLFTPEEQKALFDSIFPFVDVLKVANDEIDCFLERKETVSETVQSLFDRSSRLKAVLFTKGRKGISLYRRNHIRLMVPAFKVDNIVDAIGCGDAAFGAFCGFLASKDALIGDFDKPDSLYRDALGVANLAGSLTLSHRGALPMPSKGRLHRAAMRLSEE